MAPFNAARADTPDALYPARLIQPLQPDTRYIDDIFMYRFMSVKL